MKTIAFLSLVAAVAGDYQVETTVGVRSGISLEKEGFLLDRSGRHYTSLFLNVPNPVTVSETCAGICGSVVDLILEKARNSSGRCSSIYTTAKSDTAIVKKLTIPTHKVARDCLHLCLHHPDCMHAGIKGDTCILRSRELRKDEVMSGSTEKAELALPCLMKEATKDL